MDPASELLDATALRTDLVARAARIGETIAAPAADSVDRDARFPAEAIAALRAERMLSAFVPAELGGLGAGVGDLAAICETLGRHCSATAMIYAMHQIEVICLVRHGLSAPHIHRYLASLVESEALIASATSEVGIGGDVRSSLCAVDRRGERFTLEKQAPVISYGEHADDILATARRAPDAAANDQVLVLLHRGDLTLERTSEWNTLGFRGTCSPGFKLAASGDVGQILGDPFADISTRTMLPASHILWTSLWLGIATAAVEKAHAFVRADARKRPGVTPPASVRLAELVSQLQMMRANVHDTTREYERVMDDADALASLGFSIRMNNLKVGSSQLVVRIVSEALLICGMAGYKTEGPYSMGRHLRDAYGTMVMINNDRIYGANASMLLVHKGE